MLVTPTNSFPLLERPDTRADGFYHASTFMAQGHVLRFVVKVCPADPARGHADKDLVAGQVRFRRLGLNNGTIFAALENLERDHL